MRKTGSESAGMLKTLDEFYKAESSYLAAGGGDFSPIAATLDPQCVIYQPRSLPYGGEWHGHDGFERWMRLFTAMWASLEVKEPQQLLMDEVVISRSHVYAERRGSGEKFDWPLLQYFTFREGLILELWPFYWDTATLLAQLSSPMHDQ